MSTNLWWRPVPTNKDPLPDRLKYVLRDRESWSTLSREPAQLTRADRSYFEGLRDAGVEGATTVLDAIEKHDAIEIWLE